MSTARIPAGARPAALLLLALLTALAPRSSGAQALVAASVETTPVPSSGDAADDPAIWIHPTDPAQSTLIGTDKDSGLAVYDLAGSQIHFYAVGQMNNVDLRHHVPLAGGFVDLVAASDRTRDQIAVYRVDPATRGLVAVAVPGGIPAGITVYGFCLYHSPVSGRLYGFINSDAGEVEQWELTDAGGGLVGGALVRSFSVGSTTEGCVADDEYADLYIGEENVGIWRYGAEPGDGTARTQVDATGAGGHLTADVEGLAIYYAGDGTGYLLASSQGSDSYVLYTREGANAYLGTFSIGAAGGIDGTSQTDGIDVINVPLGTAFPSGLFAVQDGVNDVGNQNYKLVPWQSIAGAFVPALTIDPSWHPRPACADGQDNDGDSLSDYPADPGCESPEDDDEANACADADADAVCDGSDVCLGVSDPSQLDSDLDGFGNACDADYDNDGGTAGTDYFMFLGALFTAIGNPAYQPAMDFDADGAIAGTDYFFVLSRLDGPPGPSGLACAGTIPCAP